MVDYLDSKLNSLAGMEKTGLNFEMDTNQKTMLRLLYSSGIKLG